MRPVLPLLLSSALALAACIPSSLSEVGTFPCDTAGECPSGMYCTADRVCAALTEDVDELPCQGGSRSCPTGFECVAETTCRRLCVTQVPDCSSCFKGTTYMCPTGQSCLALSYGASLVCLPGANPFSPCETDADCALGTCMALAGGEKQCIQSCTVGGFCSSGTCTDYCTDAECTKKTKLCLQGPKCYQCPAGQGCRNGQCVSGKAFGEKCAADGECASGLCDGPATGDKLCLAVCHADGSCDQGDCIGGGGAKPKLCVPASASDGRCSAGAYALGHCWPGKSVGAPCTADEECTGGRCRLPAEGFSGGMCVQDCSSQKCGAGSTCAYSCKDVACARTEASCYPSCAKDADCRAGYGCVDAFGVKVCRPKGTSAEGASCSSDAECATGTCGLVMGKKVCATLCSGDAQCGAGRLCASNSYQSFSNRCGQPCANGCGANEVCGCFGEDSSGTSRQGCQPKCTADGDCFPGSTCDTSTGLCGRKTCRNAADCGQDAFCSYYPPYDSSCSYEPQQIAACRFVNGSGGKVGDTCGGLTCQSSMCVGLYFKTRGYCEPACPDGTGCPSGTTCKTVLRPQNADGSGPVSTVKVCAVAAASNASGPCATNTDCPSSQHCTSRGFCDGNGTLGSPCASHNFYAECSVESTNWCTWNSYGSTCSKDCSTDADCTNGGFPGGCCRNITGGRVCMTAAMCK